MLPRTRTQVKAIGEELGFEFIGLGFDPKHPIKDIPIMPKARYGLMRSYMPTVGTKGLDMMFRTCTVQVRGGQVCVWERKCVDMMFCTRTVVYFWVMKLG